MEFLNADEILNRAKIAWGIKLDNSLAGILSVSKATVSIWRRRNSINFDTLFSNCKHIRADWLLFGKGNVFDMSEVESPKCCVMTRIAMFVSMQGGYVSDLNPSLKSEEVEGMFVEEYLLNSVEPALEPASLGFDWIRALAEHYPGVSIMWVYDGKTPMRDGSSSESDVPDASMQSEIPLFNSPITHYLSPTIIGYMSIPVLSRVDGATYMKGNSMEPVIKSGDIVFFRNVKASEDSLIWGQMYLLTFRYEEDDYPVIRYIKKSERSGSIQLVCANTFYQPQDISIESIETLSLIVANMSIQTMM